MIFSPQISVFKLKCEELSHTHVWRMHQGCNCCGCKWSQSIRSNMHVQWFLHSVTDLFWTRVVTKDMFSFRRWALMMMMCAIAFAWSNYSFIQCDEDQHPNETVKMHCQRMCQVEDYWRSIGVERSIIWLRINMDSFTIDNVNTPIDNEKRLQTIAAMIHRITECKQLQPSGVLCPCCDAISGCDGKLRLSLTTNEDYTVHNLWGNIVSVTDDKSVNPEQIISLM